MHHSPSEDDLVEVIKGVIDMAAEWNPIRLALRLKTAELNTISSMNNTDPKNV